MKALLLDHDEKNTQYIREVDLKEPLRLIDKYWYDTSDGHSCFAAACYHPNDRPQLEAYCKTLTEAKAIVDEATKKLYAHPRTPLQ